MEGLGESSLLACTRAILRDVVISFGRGRLTMTSDLPLCACATWGLRLLAQLLASSVDASCRRWALAPALGHEMEGRSGWKWGERGGEGEKKGEG